MITDQSYMSLLAIDRYDILVEKRDKLTRQRKNRKCHQETVIIERTAVKETGKEWGSMCLQNM